MGERDFELEDSSRQAELPVRKTVDVIRDGPVTSCHAQIQSFSKPVKICFGYVLVHAFCSGCTTHRHHVFSCPRRPFQTCLHSGHRPNIVKTGLAITST